MLNQKHNLKPELEELKTPGCHIILCAKLKHQNLNADKKKARTQKSFSFSKPNQTKQEAKTLNVHASHIPF